MLQQYPQLLRVQPRSQWTFLPNEAVVTETGSLPEGEALAESLRDLPGVSFVDVVMVDFSEEER